MPADHKEPGLEIRGLSDDPKKRANAILEMEKTLREIGPTGDREFLKALGLHILEEKPLHHLVRFYLGHALLDIAEGKTLRTAFRMPGAGRPRDRSTLFRDLHITLEIAERMRSGKSLEKAAYDIGDAHNVSEHTAQKAYKRHCRLLKNYPDLTQFKAWLEQAEAWPNVKLHLMS